MLILEAFNHCSWVFDVGLVFFNNVKIVFIMLTFWHIWMAMQMSPDRFLDPYKTMLPCWELQFAWSSQQKEPDCHPQPLRSCLWWSVPQHKSVPATRSKASNGNGVAEVWMHILIPCLAGRGVATPYLWLGLCQDLATFTCQFCLGVSSTYTAVCWC